MSLPSLARPLILAFAGTLIPFTALADPPPIPPATTPPPPTPAQVQGATAEAKRLSDAFVGVAEKVSPSVVQIDVTTRDEAADQVQRWFGRGGTHDTPIARGMGSGVVFTADGAILTNNHVIDEALSINVRLRDGRYLPAHLVGRDPATDIAVIKVEATGLTPARLGDADAARVGEWVVAIGSPFGLGYTVTAGVLSAKGRGSLGMNAIEDYLQTDASINPGNSGGPLCDLDGKVLGINTMIVGKATGIGFAVPSNMAQRVAQQIMKTGHVQRAWIGVGIQDLTPELAAAMKLDTHAGALINAVNEGGPAAKSNLKPGDVIAAVAGKPVHDGHDLVKETIAHDVGTQVQLEIIRNGQRYGASVTLSARPDAAVPPIPAQQIVPNAGLGLNVRDLTPQQAQSLGLPAKPLPVVTHVTPGSPADRAGLKANDIIVECDGIPDPNSMQVQQSAGDGQLVLRVKRGEVFFYAALKR